MEINVTEKEQPQTSQATKYSKDKRNTKWQNRRKKAGKKSIFRVTKWKNSGKTFAGKSRDIKLYDFPRTKILYTRL